MKWISVLLFLISITLTEMTGGLLSLSDQEITLIDLNLESESESEKEGETETTKDSKIQSSSVIYQKAGSDSFTLDSFQNHSHIRRTPYRDIVSPPPEQG